MNSLKDLKVNASIDGLSLSCSPRSGDVFLSDTIGDYHKIDGFKKNFQLDQNLKKIDKRCKHYSWRLVFEHQSSKNLLWICNDRITKRHLIPPLYLHFFSSYHSPLRFHEVKDALSSLEKDQGYNFRISKTDVAIDLIHPQRINLHRKVLNAINIKKKQKIEEIKGTTKTLVIGSPRSSNRIIVYDKRQQLMETKDITVPEDISRIEIRLKSHALNNTIQTIDDLQQKAWASGLYGRYFSLDHPLPQLKELLGKRLASKPIWKLKSILASKFGSVPNNFHRDYIRETKGFGPAVRNALAEFLWN